jgi:6-phosphogluconolactonase
MFAVDAGSGRLTPIGHEPTRGQTPRSFQIDPAGAYLLVANQDSGTLVTFAIDAATGRLSHRDTRAVGENVYYVRLAGA